MHVYVTLNTTMKCNVVGRILEKPVKHSAPPRVLQASLVFCQHSPIVHYYTIKARDSFLILK